MLSGTYEHSIDAKGRVIIPSKLRENLGEHFIITKNVDHCLAIYPESEWVRFKEKLDTLPKISSEPARRMRRFFFGSSVECEVDKQGRIIIPGTLREYADLEKEIVYVGVDDHIEVWNAEKYRKYDEETDIDDILYDLDGLNV